MEVLLVFGAVAWLENLLVSSMVVLEESSMAGLMDRYARLLRVLNGWDNGWCF